MMGATITVKPYSAKAWPRFSGGKVSVNMDCSDGASPPPPMPCAMRASTKKARLGAMPQKNELTVNTATDIM